MLYGGPAFAYEQRPNSSKNVAKFPANCRSGRCDSRVSVSTAATGLPIGWNGSVTVCKGEAGYSWLTPVSQPGRVAEMVGAAFERGFDQAPDTVSFALIEISEAVRTKLKSDDSPSKNWSSKSPITILTAYTDNHKHLTGSEPLNMGWGTNTTQLTIVHDASQHGKGSIVVMMSDCWEGPGYVDPPGERNTIYIGGEDPHKEPTY